MKGLMLVPIVIEMTCCLLLAAAPDLDERPANSDEWGYRPADGSRIQINPPGFSWRPQKGIVRWELECGRGGAFDQVSYRFDEITMNVHCPSRVFEPGEFCWRYRGIDQNGAKTKWSTVRRFRIAEDAGPMPLPKRDELLARIPASHPRLFLRPEELPHLRELAKSSMADQFKRLVASCDKLMASPPNTEEPDTYPETMKRGSPEWKKLWWGNRTHTIRALDGAATLAFTRLLGGKDKYGHLAKRILLDCAEWDPKGATGYRYNDEAGMPFAYYFARTYTFVNDLLTEEEQQTCRRVMKVRGEEMYQHLYPGHLWRPYSSHSNRAWHFLGEVGIAFLGEIEGADDWVWFSMNVFRNVYPVWSDEDGGWHEGVMYWSSYVNRFTWWADVMRTSMRINAFDKPYFAKAGYFSMYLLPPGKVGGGFGDGATRRKASHMVPLVSELAAQSGNEHWQWYVDQMGGARTTGGYIGFIRGALPKVTAKAPTSIPTSKLFRGIGQAALNTTLLDAKEDVQVIFKSSPMGTRSHGNASNNSFVLWAYGERLLTRTGHYYMYAGPHHRDWVWSTRSLNNITVDGQSQIKRSSAARGEIVDFATTKLLDGVVGEAGSAYPGKNGKGQLLNRYTRTILFVKPELIAVYDRLVAKQPSSYEYWLHSPEKFEFDEKGQIQLSVGDVGCGITALLPNDLAYTQTDQYDPNPWPTIKTREWHLTAKTRDRSDRCEFLFLYRPHRKGKNADGSANVKRVPGGLLLEAGIGGGNITALLPTDDEVEMSHGGLSAKGQVVLQRTDDQGNVVETIRLDAQ